MVKMLSMRDKANIEQAVAQAEAMTDAELAVVIAHVSDEYRAVALSAGLVLGSFIALLLWYFKIAAAFPSLLLIELGVCGLLMSVPLLRHICLKLAPKQLLHQRAAQRAMAEYVHLIHHLPAHVPVVLLYVSLAERYVHIYSSREVREQIPDNEWNAVVRTLTGNVKKEGISAAITQAVAHGGEMLKGAFPPTGRKHAKVHVEELKG